MFDLSPLDTSCQFIDLNSFFFRCCYYSSNCYESLVIDKVTEAMCLLLKIYYSIISLHDVACSTFFVLANCFSNYVFPTNVWYDLITSWSYCSIHFHLRLCLDFPTLTMHAACAILLLYLI